MNTKAPVAWKTYKCKECGKNFEAMQGFDWAYAIGNRRQKRTMFCSWHCLQGYRREHQGRVYKKYLDA